MAPSDRTPTDSPAARRNVHQLLNQIAARAAATRAFVWQHSVSASKQRFAKQWRGPSAVGPPLHTLKCNVYFEFCNALFRSFFIGVLEVAIPN